MRNRGIPIIVTIASALVVRDQVTAQSRAAADPDPPITVSMSFTGETNFGHMEGGALFTADVSDGGALVTLFPSQPPFTHCTLHGFHETTFLVQRIFPVFYGATDIRVTITNLRVEAEGYRLSEARSRWGSCGRDSVVRVHWRLVQAPRVAMEYVVAHELVHLLHRNHSPVFWTTLAETMPTWAEAKRLLERWEVGHRAV